MRAVRVTVLGGPEAVELAEVEEPVGDGVVVDVHAAGVAFPDALLTRGLYQYRPQLPFTLGAELAGVVRSAPEGAAVKPGDRVVGLTMIGGAMAETAVLGADRVFPPPDNISFESGAGLLFNDLTVYFALTTRAAFPPANRCWCTARRAASAHRLCAWRRPWGKPGHCGGQHRGENGRRPGGRRYRCSAGRRLQGRRRRIDRRQGCRHRDGPGGRRSLHRLACVPWPRPAGSWSWDSPREKSQLSR